MHKLLIDKFSIINKGMAWLYKPSHFKDNPSLLAQNGGRAYKIGSSILNY